MRTLSSTLLAAQQAATHVPVVRVTASNRVCGVVRLDWDRLYTGAEPDYYHTLAMAGDGSMIRVRLTPPADTRKLYHQQVASPGPGADFREQLRKAGRRHRVRVRSLYRPYVPPASKSTDHGP